MGKYNNYAIDNNVNIIPEADFKTLIRDTFKVITSVVGSTAGPYGSQVMMTFQNESTTTKDGYNAFCAINFKDPYKRMVYLAIKNICERVNNTVGDGTTSCILIAEALFNRINDIVNTPEDKRNLLAFLTRVETELQKPNYFATHPLDKNILHNLVSMSSNYDEELTNKIIEAFDPVYNETGLVSSIKNVIPEQMHNMDGMETKITTMKLPGDYHIRIKMEAPDIEACSVKNDGELRVVLYDHAMTESEWMTLEKPHENDRLIIIARDFTAGVLNRCFVKYINDKKIVGESLNVFPCWILGSVQTELKDLAAVLGCEVHSLVTNDKIKYEDCTPVDIEIFNDNCMGFNINNKKHPDLVHYINNLKKEMAADISNSIVGHEKYLDRIKALEMDNQDVIITCSGTSQLEMSMTMDKIMDCVSIVNSAFKYGTVPNLLLYGYQILNNMYYGETLTVLEIDIMVAIKESVTDLFKYIYISKYGSYDNIPSFSDLNEMIDDFYHGDSVTSFDIVSEETVPFEKFPTSAQYDIEVLVAAISIVKYLITSRSLIYDATQTAAFEM